MGEAIKPLPVYVNIWYNHICVYTKEEAETGVDFAVGNRLLVDGDDYKVVGKILYRNENDGMTWTEYRMLKCSSGSEYWLSVDDYYREYSISKVVHLANIKGYHEVDSGTEVVVQRWGDVDVDAGERAGFTEYEDDTEEKILSYEFWSDGKEISKGYYLDENEIELIEAGNGATLEIEYSL